MIRPPPRSTLDRSSAASDVYKRQGLLRVFDEEGGEVLAEVPATTLHEDAPLLRRPLAPPEDLEQRWADEPDVAATGDQTEVLLGMGTVSYTHLTLPPSDLVSISGVAVSLKKKTTKQKTKNNTEKR